MKPAVFTVRNYPYQIRYFKVRIIILNIWCKMMRFNVPFPPSFRMSPIDCVNHDKSKIIPSWLLENCPMGKVMSKIESKK